jgi:hypothetical protein
MKKDFLDMCELDGAIVGDIIENEDGSVDVYGAVVFDVFSTYETADIKLKRLPIKFGKIGPRYDKSGCFSTTSLGLTSLDNFPDTTIDLYVNDNKVVFTEEDIKRAGIKVTGRCVF